MSIAPRARLATHEVFNQPLPRERLELWSADAPLQAAVAEAAPGDAGALAAFAAEIGSPQALDDAERAQRVKPELVVFDRGGRREGLIFGRGLGRDGASRAGLAAREVLLDGGQ